MAKEINEYTTSELFTELWRRTIDDSDVFSVQLWMREDLEAVMPAKDVDAFMKANRKCFNDRMIELGWEVLEVLC